MQNYKLYKYAATGALLLCLSACDNVAYEEVTDNNGVVTACGNTDGLTPCTYDDGDSISGESDKQLDKDADAINKGTRKQREKAIGDIEAQGGK